MKIAEMPKYEAYKDSGVEWIGSIPAKWEVKKFKFLLTEINIRSTTGGEQLLSLSKYSGVVPKDSLEERAGAAESLKGYKKVFANDLVINKMQAVNGLLAISRLNGITSPDYAVYRPKNPNLMDCYYLGYLLSMPEYLGEFKRRVTGVMEGFIRLYTDDLYSIHSISPCIKTQTLIANFLDKKTAQIDEAIAIKEQQIALLKERKQIIIQKAVTQGLDPKVPMKDSGVDWIGQIPEHWEVKKLKYLGDAVIGLTYSPADLCVEGEGVLVARSSNLFEGQFRYGEKENVYVKSKIPDKLFLRERDILICSRNGSRDLIGKCAFVSQSDAGISFGAFTTVFRSSYNEYLFHIFNSDIFKMLSGSFLTSTINQLTIGNLNSIEVPIPTKDEQIKISDYIKRISAATDKAVTLQVQQIQKLKEYKTTLINSAVTGKIKITQEMVEAGTHDR